MEVEIDHLHLAPTKTRLTFLIYAYAPKVLLVIMVPFIFYSPSILMIGYLCFVLLFLGYGMRFIHNIEAGKAYTERVRMAKDNAGWEDVKKELAP